MAELKSTTVERVINTIASRKLAEDKDYPPVIVYRANKAPPEFKFLSDDVDYVIVGSDSFLVDDVARQLAVCNYFIKPMLDDGIVVANTTHA